MKEGTVRAVVAGLVAIAALWQAAHAGESIDAKGKEPMGKRRITVSTITFGLPGPSEDVPRFKKEDRVELARRSLEVAGERGSDIACLPEVFATKRTENQGEAEAVPGGPVSAMMAEQARKWHMYVTGTLYEDDGGKVYNTAPLFDREGRLVGKFRKVHIPDEELKVALAGDSYPVFETDFGKVGVLICWDIQFPEAARCMALNGAEIIFWPTMYGGDPSTVAIVEARAIENNVYIVSSNYAVAGVPHVGFSAIVSPFCEILANTGNAEGVATAVVDLDHRPDRPDLARERMPETYGRLVEK